MTNLKLVFDRAEDQKIEDIKKEYGVKQTTELIRLLITLKYKEIKEMTEVRKEGKRVS